MQVGEKPAADGDGGGDGGDDGGGGGVMLTLSDFRYLTHGTTVSSSIDCHCTHEFGDMMTSLRDTYSFSEDELNSLVCD
jgi:hypothetical protein